MKMPSKLFAAILVFASLPSGAEKLAIRAFNLTQLGLMKYAANPTGPKTEAQKAVDYMKSLGANHVVLIPEARMADYTSNNVVPATPVAELARERRDYLNLITYIHSLGMTVGLRPIILVERTGRNSEHWHGNIQPTNPTDWFKSLRDYLKIYSIIGKLGRIEEFTVGAELYSMTVGLEDQWPEHQYGFPREWTLLVQDLRAQLGSQVRMMYDINYTDTSSNQDGTGASGGEFERWRYRLADLKPDATRPATITPNNAAAWQQLVDLWNSFDAIGIDMYRSLMSRNDPIPSNYDALVQALEERASQFAADIDIKLLEIEMAVGSPKKIIFKEIGFKSCTRCFIDPFSYDDPNKTVNIEHQAAAYQAFLNAFVKPAWAWMMGIVWWDIAVNPNRAGELDPGFSPRGKTLTEKTLKAGWL